MSSRFRFGNEFECIEFAYFALTNVGAFFLENFFQVECFSFTWYNILMVRLKKRGRRFHWLRRFCLIHASVTGAVLFLYAFFGFLWGSMFSIADFREVWRSFADEDVVVSAVVLPPPSVPIVSVEAICPSGTLFVGLDWPDDEGATSFDVYRDGSPLVSGLVLSEYHDVSVSTDTDYSYVVIAYGPMGPGIATSASVSVTTPSSCLTLLSPVLSIVTVAETNVESVSSVSVSNTTPTVTGTSNMPNASVELSIVGSTSVYALFATNATGYWSWTPTAEIDPGTYTLTVRVTHPLHPLQTASDTLMLTILSPSSSSDDDGGGSKKKQKKRSSVTLPSPTYRVPPETPVTELPEIPQGAEPVPPFSPAALSLDVVNPGNWVFQWRTLETSLTIDRLNESYEGSEGEIEYRVSNAEGEEVFSVMRSVRVHRGDVFREAIPIPRQWRSGDYRVTARLRTGLLTVQTEAPFAVVDLPIFDLGGGMMVTWTGAVRFLGWTSLWSLLFLLLLSLLFVREYWLYLHSREHIDDLDLPGKGLFRSEKGKGVKRI